MDQTQLNAETGADQLKPVQADTDTWPGWKTLLGGVVHDFNNLLQVVLAMAAMLRQKLGAGHAGCSHVEVIEQCALRAAALGEKLRAFTTPERRSRGLLDLNGLVKDVCRVLRIVLPPPGRLEVSAADEPVWVMGDPSELLRTILELCEGAFGPAARGGTLRIALHHAAASPTSCLQLSIDPCAPNGAASEERAERVLVSHGGKLDVVRAESERVEFDLTLPTVQGTKATAVESAVNPVSQVSVGSEMHDAMRELLSGMLRELGCVVLKVSQTSSEPKGGSP
jgi:hypothetical protein